MTSVDQRYNTEHVQYPQNVQFIRETLRAVVL